MSDDDLTANNLLIIIHENWSLRRARGTMSRTNTTARTIFTLSRPNNNNVTYTLRANPERPYRTRITLPPDSTWTPSPHWHERYTEYIRCVTGRLLLRLNGEEKVITPDDGPQVVEKGVVHEFMRADVYGYASEDGTGEGEDVVVVEEWMDPSDGVKEVFFRNLLSTLLDAEQLGSRLGWQLKLIEARYDNWPVIWQGWGRRWVTVCSFVVAEVMSRLMGLEAWSSEYTPVELRMIAQRKQRSWWLW